MTKNTVKTMIIILILLAVGLYFISGTYARYTSTISGEGEVQVAKWAVKINDEDATQANAKFNITFTEVDNDNIVDGFIAPTSQLYADFKIDPAGSQVAIDYSFTLGEILASTGEVPSTVKVAKVVPVVQGEEQTALTPSEGKYTGKIELKDQGQALTESEAVTMRVYIEWEDSNTTEANAIDTTVGISAPTLTLTVSANAIQSVE